MRITVYGKRYYSHRLVFLYVSGEFPKHEVDHINHDPSDNRLKNLRLVDHLENHKNTSMKKNNTSGVTGVSWSKACNKWQARIDVGKKGMHLGEFTDIHKAIDVRKAAEVAFGYHQLHGVA